MKGNRATKGPEVTFVLHDRSSKVERQINEGSRLVASGGYLIKHMLTKLKG